MKRTIEVSTAGTHLHLQLGSLAISRERELVGKVPLEDLGVLILASSGLTITSAALSGIAEHGGVTVVAGPDHQPEGVLLPLRANTTRGERIKAQVTAKLPVEKQLWSALIRSKIENQAALISDPAGNRRMLRLASELRSGDPGNLEAQAARVFWPLVFADNCQDFCSSPFRRSREGAWPNNFLNYGYAILRAMTARAICGAGLLPEVGIHHHSRYDSFALASDLMEPFRPWVDHRCQELVAEGPAEIDRNSKQALLSVYDDPVMLGTEKTPLFIAIERCASSLAHAFLDAKAGATAIKAADSLQLPAFCTSRES